MPQAQDTVSAIKTFFLVLSCLGDVRKTEKVRKTSKLWMQFAKKWTAMRDLVLTKQMTSRVSYHLQILLEGCAQSLTMQLSFPIFLIWRVLWGNRFQKAAIYQRLKENPQEIASAFNARGLL